MRRGGVLGIAVVGMLIATSCAGNSVSTSTSVATTSTISNLGGDRLPVQQPGENYGQQQIELSGTLSLEPNGCWKIELEDGTWLIVFPVGFRKDATDGSIMQDDSGMRYSDGMHVEAMGGLVAATNFPGIPDGFWGFYLGFCNSLDDDIVVLDSMTQALDS